ncbi:unnamed protein product [Clonostachys solani]|uniref:Heterokaryon incompatibility domain-containing protein n=1 Tax=Clonostachys solani TaxID=160281 RepID=A0A9N9W667_9HYPO|nr:unnamed protein product [Clonostachys solani]
MTGNVRTLSTVAADAPDLYRPLDSSVPEIRLFALEPAQSDEGAIIGHLQTVPLGSAPAYEALSYMWGKPVYSEPITIAGHTVLVTPNLAVALRGLRFQDRQRVLWIDALCINQKSLHERAQQISLMKEIYSHCVRDLLWLGPLSKSETQSYMASEELMGQGFELIQHLVDRDMTVLDPMVKEWKDHKQLQREFYRSIENDLDNQFSGDQTTEGKEEQPGSQETHGESRDKDKDAKRQAEEEQRGDEAGNKATRTGSEVQDYMLSSDEQWALESAFDYPDVLQRLWVMQELSLAPKVQLVAGRHTLDWDVVSDFLGDTPYADAFHGTFSHGSVAQISYYMFEKVQIIDHQRRISRQADQGGESKLLDVLARFRHTHCLDPRDKIFGLLGLVTDHKDIKVDYEKPPAQVYAEVTASLINHSGNLDVICQSPWSSSRDYRRPAEGSLGNLPSWAINFLADGDIELFAQRSIFNAGKPSCEVPCRRVDEDVLVANGVIVGQVGPILQHDYPHDGKDSALHRRYDSSAHIPLDWMRLYLNHQVLDRGSTDQCITGESSFTAFWRTLTVDCAAWPTMARLTSQQIEDQDMALRENWSQFLDGVTDEGTNKSNLDREYFSTPDNKLMWDRLYTQWSFSTTTNGLFIMIIPPTREGDVIACLDGAKLPVVLRPVQRDGLQTFQIVTVAYVHGIMDMEATESPELRAKLGLQDQEFWIV